MMQPINYLMRGVRVEILSEDTIDFFANEAAKFLGVDKRTRKKWIRLWRCWKSTAL